MKNRELLRQQLEKLLWKHYEPDQAMNGEEASEEFLKLFEEREEELVKKIEGLKEAWKTDSLMLQNFSGNEEESDIHRGIAGVFDSVTKLIKG